MSEHEYLSVAETAKMLRFALKKTFPTTTFSVRSKSYSGGASIDVGWLDGPTNNAVKRVTSQFTGADFDGMIDMKTYNSSWVMPDGSACVARDPGTVGSMGVFTPVNNPKPHPDAKLVHFGADFIFTNRAHSLGAMKEAVREVCLKYGHELCMVHGDESGAYIDSSDPAGDQGGNRNCTSIWTLRNLAYAYLEAKYPYDEPKPGDAAYEALKAKIAALESRAA